VRRPLASLLLLPLLAGATLAQEQPSDAIAALQDRLDKGELHLTYAEDGHGYLRSVLAALNIPEESQVLPFTRSSLMTGLISPATPRAVYFNDDVAIGVVHGSSMFELIVNGRDGPAFYTFATNRRSGPRFHAEISRCTFCHNREDGAASQWIVANVIAGANGNPLRPGGIDPRFDLTDHATAFEKRWGGWYVTGTTGAMRHHGNVTLAPGAMELPTDAGLNVIDLSGRFDAGHTIASTSDVVALMTLEHQAGFINRAAVLNGRYTEAGADELAAYLTFASEVPLPGPITGNSGFTARFAATGPRDGQGRSLRAYDLKTRLFRYPLSYMVTSSAFDSLSPQARARVWRRLGEILRATPEGRNAMAIAATTVPGAPDTWKTP
jgi:hypothetical protein